MGEGRWGPGPSAELPPEAAQGGVSQLYYCRPLGCIKCVTIRPPKARAPAG